MRPLLGQVFLLLFLFNYFLWAVPWFSPLVVSLLRFVLFPASRCSLLVPRIVQFLVLSSFLFPVVFFAFLPCFLSRARDLARFPSKTRSRRPFCFNLAWLSRSYEWRRVYSAPANSSSSREATFNPWVVQRCRVFPWSCSFSGKWILQQVRSFRYLTLQ